MNVDAGPLIALEGRINDADVARTFFYQLVLRDGLRRIETRAWATRAEGRPGAVLHRASLSSAGGARDTGSPLSPLENRPPRDGHDPHDDTPKIQAAQQLKDMFWRPRGFVNDVCNGGPCTGPQF